MMCMKGVLSLFVPEDVYIKDAEGEDRLYLYTHFIPI